MKKKKVGRLKTRLMVAHEFHDLYPRIYEDSMQIWHGVFSTVSMHKSFIEDLENICIKHDVRMVLTKQKK